MASDLDKGAVQHDDSNSDRLDKGAVEHDEVAGDIVVLRRRIEAA